MNKTPLIFLLCAMSAGLCVGRPALAQSDADEARMQAMQRETDNDVVKRGEQKHIELLSKQFQLPGSEIEKLRNGGQGWGEVTIRLALADKLTKTDLNQRAGDYNSLAKELWNFWSDVSEIVRRKKK